MEGGKVMKQKVKMNACAICALQHGDDLVHIEKCYLNNQKCDVLTKEEVNELRNVYPNLTKKGLNILLNEIALKHYVIVED